ncbi:hypothetical protein TRFO_03563 [Tritrichomonas foetus]|uniref:Uncharacterized protein n=1 Tax=Tritrichomonas foetus TaxID=1144522 RepID=A0A1J4KN68_9EUKA|nr:hypothetical protein TRFO_03563 [Tritrichomonas foetus]|eukprot:OHT12562.1 hypothetical protein TRFO_03563 [Tritrichomonas foetus]
MSIQLPVVPETEQYLSLEELNDPNIELIFVQHGPQVSTKQAEHAYKNFQKNTTSHKLTITHLAGQNPVYPVAYGDGELHVSRKVDQYLIATPSA